MPIVYLTISGWVFKSFSWIWNPSSILKSDEFIWQIILSQNHTSAFSKAVVELIVEHCFSKPNTKTVIITRENKFGIFSLVVQTVSDPITDTVLQFLNAYINYNIQTIQIRQLGQQFRNCCYHIIVTRNGDP